jgi:T5SS/PEP-CTERM-associated repeat protein
MHRELALALSIIACGLSAEHQLLAAITATGDVAPDPATTTSGHELTVGNTSHGLMHVDEGSDVTSSTSYVGREVGGIGVARVVDSGSSWDVSGLLYVGYEGSGSLEVSNNGRIESGFASIGYAPGPSANATVSGSGSTWVTQGLEVGRGGIGTLSITGGGRVDTEHAAYVESNGGQGTAVVDGTNSSWSVGDWLQVGTRGIGILEISNGGRVSTVESGVIAADVGGSGEVRVTGVGSSWVVGNDANDNLHVGNDGHGTLRITGGGQVTNGGASILGTRSVPSNPTGIVQVDGAGSTWTSGGRLSVGTDATGTIEITRGGRVTSGGMSVLGLRAGANGTVIVDGADSVWSSSGGVNVGEAGNGTLQISDGGRVEVGGETWVARSGGHGSIHFNDGTLTTGSLLAAALRLGGSGTINAHGVVSDINLVFDASHGLEQQVVLNSQPNQNVTVNLDVDGTGPLGAGYGGQGYLRIADGVMVTSTTGLLGYLAGSSGRVEVTGAGSKWTSAGTLSVGTSGMGALEVRAGGNVTSSGSIYLAELAGSSGAAIVDGAGSVLSSDQSLLVGDLGPGTLEITGGGRVSSGIAHVGRLAGSSGSVSVDGEGSLWSMTHLHVGGGALIGGAGTGTVSITNGGTVSCFDCYIAAGGPGTLTVNGAGSLFRSRHELRVGRVGLGTLNITGGGTVEVDGNLWLGYFTGGNGIINLSDGTLRLDGKMAVNLGTGTLNFTGGRLEVAGEIDLKTALVQNGGTFAPGNSAGITTIQVGYTVDHGTLEIEINGAGTAGVDWDQVKVNGAVDLLGANALPDGRLDVKLGFAPAIGAEFLILDNDASDPIGGMFANGRTVKAAYSAGLYEFAIDYSAGTGNDLSLITQAVSLLGDYNGDGTVDAADYVHWRAAANTAVTHYSSADGSGNGLVDDEDYLVWRSNFGLTSAAIAAAIESDQRTAVPEPTAACISAALLMLALVRNQRQTNLQDWFSPLDGEGLGGVTRPAPTRSVGHNALVTREANTRNNV